MQSSERVGRERACAAPCWPVTSRPGARGTTNASTACSPTPSGACGGLRDAADEVVQETWLIAVRRIRAFDPEAGSFAGWIRGIAANLVNNRFRKEHTAANGRLRLHAAESEPVDADLLRREQAQRVAHALADLSERHEAILRAKYLEGRAVADIAAAWHETPKAVESLLTRAREAFRAAYGPLE